MTKGYLPVYVCFLFFKTPSIYSLPPTQALASPAGHRPVCAWPRLRDAIVSMLKWLLLVVSSNGDWWRTPTHLCALMIWLIMKLVYARRASMRDSDCSPCQSALNYSKRSQQHWLLILCLFSMSAVQPPLLWSTVATERKWKWEELEGQRSKTWQR